MSSASTPKSDLTRSGPRRLGDDYQDVVALDSLVEWLEHSDRYRWVRVEADDSGALDDVTAELASGTVVVKQVKFSTSPETEEDRLSWDVLLKQEPGKHRPKPSLLQKWSASVAALTSDGRSVDAVLVSNRRPSDDFRSIFRPNGTVDFDSLPEPLRKSLEQQLGGDTTARKFFDGFRFELNHPNLLEYKAGVRRRFIRLGGTEIGWKSLFEAVGEWVCYRNRPNPGGTIGLQDVKLAAQWYQLQSLPQRYEIPRDYVLPSPQFHEEMIEYLLGGPRTVSVLFASPGVGKSTYTSKLFEDLKSKDVPVARHHYFLSLNDQSQALRLDHRRAAESLMHDLLRDQAVALGDIAHQNPHPNAGDLRKWLEACGAHYVAQSRRLVLILDGLDHVWRERHSVDELNRLLQMLLPTPIGVSLLVATQPVDDTMLPAVLLRAAPRDTWCELPLLGPAETKEWLSYHVKDFAGFNDANSSDMRVERLAAALHRRSGGHPLHMRYTLRAVQEQRMVLDAEAFERLPECPHKDIVAYYDELWRVIPDEARQILHLLATTQFLWPRMGIVDCLDPETRLPFRTFAALKQIEHLFHRTELGLKPFHGSLLAFVRQVSEHANWAPILKEQALQWLLSRAPEYWKWAYTWRLSAELGDDEPLLRGPNRAWTVNAISNCRPESIVNDILSRSLACAAKHRRFSRAIELGLLKEYYSEALESHQGAQLPMLLSWLMITRDSETREALRSHIDELSSHQIRLVAEADAINGNAHRTDDYLYTLNERLRTNRGRSTSWQSEDRVQHLVPIVEVAALPGGPKSATIVRYAAKWRKEGCSARILSIFAERLRAQRDFARLLALLEPVPERDGEVAVNLTQEERDTVATQIALLALEDGKNCDHIALTLPSHPILQIYSAIRQLPSYQPEKVSFPDANVLNVKEYELYRYQREADSLFIDSFFVFLASHLWNNFDEVDNWLRQLSGAAWPLTFLNHLNNVARGLAADIAANRVPRIADVVGMLSANPKPRFRGNIDRADYEYGVVAARAITAISFSLAAAFSKSAGIPIITKGDVQVILGSEYCPRDSWITRYIASRRLFLADDAVEWLIARSEEELAASYGQFPERAERFAELSAMAALHGRLEVAQRLLIRTGENLLAHGPHKDLLFHHVLGAIEAVFPAIAPGASQADVDPAEWIRKLAPAIGKINEFTDGDETRHLPALLGDTISHACPELLPRYYQWLAETEEYSDALDALAAFARTADLTDPLAQAVVESATDDSCVRVLANRSRNGEEGAAETLSRLTAIMGETVAATQESARQSADENNQIERSPLPAADDYPPEKLVEFISAVQAVGYQRTEGAAMMWATYWSEQGRGPNAYEALVDAAERGQIMSAWDAVYLLAAQYRSGDEAYNALVRAYGDARGWNEFWGSDEQAIKYWDEIKKNFPARWIEFLADTILGASVLHGPLLGNSSFGRVIKYCIVMAQPQMAVELVEEMVNRSLELVSPCQLPIAVWASSEVNAV